MKEKIIIFVIGVLVGAVIATGAFYIYTSINNKGPGDIQMMGNEPPSFDGNRPQMPNGNQGNEPPMKPGENNSQNNSY